MENKLEDQGAERSVDHSMSKISEASTSAPEPKVPTSESSAGLKTLAIDIGGSGVKALLLNAVGEPLGDRARIKTPQPATATAVMTVIEKLTSQQTGFDRVSVGFPGVVRQGVVLTAVNLHSDWVGCDLAKAISAMTGKPVRVANDADIQGMGAIAGEGVELVATLGTGFGGALFVNGQLVPNLELGHSRFRKGETFEEQLGRAALKKVGDRVWNNRLLKAIALLSRVYNYDRLYLGGGEVSHIEVDLPENVTVVPNVLGLIGGIKLWER
ncbi:MAG: ROK family protein [Phormidesmis sp.]